MKETLLRYLKTPVSDDLKTRMVFVGGPRQVGEMVFAVRFLDPPDIQQPGYRNYDEVQVRSALIKTALPAHQPIIVLDEIHKYAGGGT